MQVESLVLKGMDEEAGMISEFVRGLIASVDNRVPQTIPVAVVQAAALKAGAAEPVAAATRTPAVAAAPRPKPRPKALPNASAPKPLRVVPAARKPAAAPSALAAPRTAARTARAATADGPKAAPAAARPPSAPEPAAKPARKPIAARTAAHSPGSQTAAAASDASKEGKAGLMRIEPEPEPDRSEWIGPHPIEEAPAREPVKPRPWTP